MRLTVPLTGTVLQEGSVWGKDDLIGDPNDPIRLVEIDLGNVSWRMVDVDIENEVMIIEVSPAEEIGEDTGQVDGGGKPIKIRRPTTKQEKIASLQNAQQIIEGHTKDELYAMSKCQRLKRPFKEKTR